jgi:hypothetical protein
MLCFLWNALFPLECFVSFGMLCFLWNALFPLECFVSFGMLCFFWNALFPLECFVSFGMLWLILPNHNDAHWMAAAFSTHFVLISYSDSVADRVMSFGSRCVMLRSHF